jgi:hypothetical protein
MVAGICAVLGQRLKREARKATLPFLSSKVPSTMSTRLRMGSIGLLLTTQKSPGAAPICVENFGEVAQPSRSLNHFIRYRRGCICILSRDTNTFGDRTLTMVCNLNPLT